ncbi:hypothetical protein V2W45_990297 [Cenococcum geophilum]
MFGGPPPPPSKAELQAQEEEALQTVKWTAGTCLLLYLCESPTSNKQTSTDEGAQLLLPLTTSENSFNTVNHNRSIDFGAWREKWHRRRIILMYF